MHTAETIALVLLRAIAPQVLIAVAKHEPRMQSA